MKKIMLLVLLFAFLLNACSYLAPKTQDITITTDIPAKIYVNGELVATGQKFQNAYEKDKGLFIVAIAEKQEPAFRMVGRHLSALGALDIVAGVLFLLPFVGLMSAGAYKFDRENIYFMLDKSKSTKETQQLDKKIQRQDNKGKAFSYEKDR